jgi:hypothetical protein
MSNVSVCKAVRPFMVAAALAGVATVSISEVSAAPASGMTGQIAGSRIVEKVQFRGYGGGFRRGYGYRGGYGWGGGPFFAGATLGLIGAGYGWGGYPYGGYYRSYGYDYGYGRPYARAGFYRPYYGYAPFYGPRRVVYVRPFSHRVGFRHAGFSHYHRVGYRY